ncbi:innexin [Plakobranchus ocellatus]|uniref:Innexin n=1 Tax=Plakobranchus ocellatus TaxID=259542 RepID=A0AAV3YMX9_9GAST|nr:innexin [Plakobranchus ocellatus]
MRKSSYEGTYPERDWFLFTASTGTQQCDPRLSGPPSVQGAVGRDLNPRQKGPTDLKADSLPTVPPTPFPERKFSRTLVARKMARFQKS